MTPYLHKSVEARRVERSGPVIRAALTEHSPEECAQFESDIQSAVVLVGEHFDLSPLDTVLDRWWRIAVIRANPLDEEERRLIARARSGDLSGVATRDEDGAWVLK